MRARASALMRARASGVFGSIETNVAVRIISMNSALFMDHGESLAGGGTVCGFGSFFFCFISVRFIWATSSLLPGSRRPGKAARSAFDASEG